jgi:hypothetical protein
MQLPLLTQDKKIKVTLGGVEIELDKLTIGVQEEVLAMDIKNPVVSAVEILARLMTSYEDDLESKKNFIRNLDINSLSEIEAVLLQLTDAKKNPTLNQKETE